MMASRSAPRPIREMISDSAKTVQVEEIGSSAEAASARGPRSATSTPSRAAVCSRKRPVPAAHLSFMAKSTGRPFGPMRMTLPSCPPMSTRVPPWPRARKTPRAWQVISVTRRAAWRTRPRP